MLKFLLDEHISPKVAEGLRRYNREWVAIPLVEWQNGEFLGQDDANCLMEAFVQGLTFVTYDQRSIAPLLKRWAEEGRDHCGVIFVDHKTIRPSAIGALVQSLVQLFHETGNSDWENRVCYLRR